MRPDDSKRNRAAAAFLAASLLAPACAMAGDADFGDLFKDALPVLDEAAAVLGEQADAPRRALFRKDKRDYQKAIDKLLDEAVAVLEISGPRDSRSRIDALTARIRAARRELAELQEARVVAPEKPVAGLHRLPFARTKQGYDALIEDVERDIEKTRRAVDAEAALFATQLRGVGLELSDEQVDQLLYSVEGDEFVALCVTFNNVKRMTGKLEELTVASGEDIETARRYYGMYVVLLKTLDRTHRLYVERIDRLHLPRLESFDREARAIVSEAESLLREAKERNAGMLRANIASARYTLDAVRLYREYLQRQRQVVAEANAELADDIATAENTYRTVRLSRELALMLRRGMQQFDALAQLQPPRLLVFKNEAVKLEFHKLSERLRTFEDG